MNVDKALEKLFSLHTFGIKLGLENITNFLEHLGNPQQKLKAFHIAGSNGKGSTSSFIASMLMEFKYKVGLYTSPHFVRFNERIKINNEEIPNEYVAKFVSEYENYIDENKLTFFEVTTALAFQYFYEQKVDFAVIETGLGGRLDATNVLSPLAVVITSISLEHTNILGTTLKEIASEKAAIIKNHSHVFTGKLPAEADEIIEGRCLQTGSSLFKISDYIIDKKNSLELYTEELELDDFKMPLRGKYQKYNSALAALAVTKVLETDDFRTISHGIKNVLKNTGLQGRYEFYWNKPDIIFDSAHNPESVQNFLGEFQKDSVNYQKRILLFGVMKDKSVKEILSMLKNSFDEIHVTQIENERVCKIEELQKIAGELDLHVTSEFNPAEFVEKFKEQNEDNCLVVAGSMYLLGEIKSFLQKHVSP
ncbi:MAG: bifunctional folylpolyglutamate synthase/dihydrofolate synthase [Ignavibacteriaceae bacterium]